jgi:uncharacterized phage protein gp47/JayE
VAEYIRIPIESDPEVLAQTVFDYIQGQAPGWAPADGNLDTWIIRSVAMLASENRDIASDVQDDIFRYFGATMIGVPPRDATYAQATTTWVMNDSLGHLISAGTTVGIRDPAGELQGFTVAFDVTVPAGQTATASGAVVILAVVPGVDGNNIGSTNGPVELVDVLDWVQSITVTGPTSGGADAELDSDYMNRLTTRLQRLSQRPILPADFSSMALDADPIVWRAVAIDGYNPANSTYSNERMIAVAAVDSAGNAVSTTVKNEIDALLQANREVNFIVNVMDPRYTTINVVTTVHIAAGFTQANVTSSITSALNNYLSPANWGQDPSVTSGAAPQTWVETTSVYYNEVITVISNVVGVDRVISLTLNGTSADVALTSPAALTRPGTVTVNYA